ncbi:MAG: Gfo/Idh/MocA family oxidoreductase [Planctomycetaceae bacterium]|nr:Gfo/Idh/MocA family oxidoreductase [Planctomycetaceae bacterium]
MLLTRRNFLQAAAGVAVATFVPRSVFADAKRPGANERLGIAAIGVGRRGAVIFAEALREERVNGVAVCDVWQKRAQDVAAKCKIPEDAVYQDYRRIIDRKDVDAILTATPEHWRSLICVNAALAGKHLYVEKPVTLTVEDGVLIRKAAKKTGIVFQCGSQHRSNPLNDHACRFIREGRLGKITEVIGANYESPWHYGMSGEAIPEGLDWDFWCGPVEPVPFNQQLFVSRGNPGWLSFWKFAGGEMTGWGTHGLDQIQRALGKDDIGPVEIFVDGEKLVPPTFDQPTEKSVGDELCAKPMVSFRYADGITVKLSRNLEWNHISRAGAIFVGEKGTVEIVPGQMTSAPREIAEDWLKENAGHKLPSHITDWINCIYAGKKPIGEMESGLRVATTCHILSIARYLGRNLKWDPNKEEFVNDAEANTWLKREHRKGFELPVL